MIKLSTVLTIACFLITFNASAFDQNVPILSKASVQQMTCPEAVKQLKAKIELGGQLGNSFLQVYEELENVYTTWGDKFSKQSDSIVFSNIAEYFQRSAKSVRGGRIQSSKTIEDLKTETALLMSRVENCVR